MNWVDVVIIVVGLVFAFVGLSQGFIRMAFSAAGLVLGIILAGRYYESLANILSSSGADWARIAAFIIIIIVTMVVAGVIGTLIQKLVSALLLGWIDRGLGFIIGAGIGLIVCAAVLTIIEKYASGIAGDAISDSTVAKFVIEQFPLLLALLPAEFDFVRNIFV